MSKRKLRAKAHVEVQTQYGQNKVYTKLLFDDQETGKHYKIKMTEAIYGELASMLRQMYQWNIADSEAEAKRYVDLVMQAMHNASANKHKLPVIVTDIVDINAAIKAREVKAE